MKLTKPRRKIPKIHKALLIVGGIIALLAITSTIYVYAFKGNLFGWQSDQTIIVPDTDQGIKEDQVPDDGDPSGTQLPPKDQDTPIDTPSTNTPSTTPEKPTIERAGGNPTITIVASFRQASNGYCELQISKAGETTKTYQAAIVLGSTYYSCSFKVARSDLPSTGPWKVTVIHHVGESQTSSDVQEVI